MQKTHRRVRVTSFFSGYTNYFVLVSLPDLPNPECVTECGYSGNSLESWLCCVLNVNNDFVCVWLSFCHCQFYKVYMKVEALWSTDEHSFVADTCGVLFSQSTGATKTKCRRYERCQITYHVFVPDPSFPSPCVPCLPTPCGSLGLAAPQLYLGPVVCIEHSGMTHVYKVKRLVHKTW